MKQKEFTLRSNVAGWTLIEIIAGILVAAVLAALLFPTLSSMLESSRAAKCQGNLRQIGNAFALYGGESGTYPPVRIANDGSDKPWSFYLDPYLGWGTWGNKSSVGICPSAKKKDAISYGYNANFPYTKFFPKGRVSKPSRLFLVSDATYTSWRVTYSNIENEVEFRHNKKANILFADGHVEPKVLDDIPPKSSRYKTDGLWNDFWGLELLNF